jgi:hypothetical protein
VGRRRGGALKKARRGGCGCWRKGGGGCEGELGAKRANDVEGKVGQVGCRAEGQGIGGSGVNAGFDGFEGDWAKSARAKEMEKATSERGLADSGVSSEENEACFWAWKRGGGGLRGAEDFERLAGGGPRDEGGESA